MTREEAIAILNNYKRYSESIYTNGVLDSKAFDMAISVLEKPNYESDKEVRLAVVNRYKEKVILFDPFGEEEYLPNEPCADMRGDK